MGLYEPGAVGVLSAEQERDPLPVRIIRHSDACNVQGVQRLSGCIGIRWSAAELRPTTTWLLPFEVVGLLLLVAVVAAYVLARAPQPGELAGPAPGATPPEANGGER